MFASDSKLPVEGGAEKRAYVQSLFGSIAPTYDRLNRIISLRLDQRWRRLAVAELGWEANPAGRYLDLCAGTLDFAAALGSRSGFHGRIVAADFVLGMLARGRGKTDRARSVVADALSLPFPEAAFDGAMIGWGLRNLIDLDAGLNEAARVLRPGARLVILETNRPAREPMRTLDAWYTDRFIPWIGRRISKHTTAYSWLPASARAFPAPEAVSELIAAAGFQRVGCRLLTGGVAALYTATRP